MLVDPELLVGRHEVRFLTHSQVVVIVVVFPGSFLVCSAAEKKAISFPL